MRRGANSDAPFPSGVSYRRISSCRIACASDASFSSAAARSFSISARASAFFPIISFCGIRTEAKPRKRNPFFLYNFST